MVSMCRREGRAGAADMSRRGSEGERSHGANDQPFSAVLEESTVG